MIRAFYISGAGMAAQQDRVNIIANNVSNISTPGYKGLKSTFAQLMMIKLDQIDPATGLPDPAKEQLSFGSGSKVAMNPRDFKVSTPIDTGRPMDFMLEDEGFFAVRDRSGQVQFTRGGQFQASMGNGNFTLVTPEGDVVLDQSGNPLTLVGAPGDIGVNQHGVISIDGVDTGRVLGRFAFSKPQGLMAVGNAFMATEASGQPLDHPNCRVKQGVLENSNVDLSTEMSDLIAGQRTYQMNARMLQWTEDIERMTNALRG